MSESFAELFEESLQELDMKPGSIVTGVVIAIENDFVVVNAGLKSEGFIPKYQFFDDKGEFLLSVGDEVSVALESLEDGFGSTVLSRDKAKQAEVWAELERAYKEESIVSGVINGKVRGGFTVDLGKVTAFLPGSLVDVRPVRDVHHLENQTLQFKLVKLDPQRNNIVVSRRAVLEVAFEAERAQLLEKLEEGAVLSGIVKNLTDYGAFIDLGGVDGLLHITDIAWKRVKHPSEVLKAGDEIQVKVLRYDRDRQRVSLGMKQLTEDPWEVLIRNHGVGQVCRARITNLADYGCFAEIAEGLEGLVHVSEMDWTNKNIHPSKVVQVGDEVDVMVLDIDENKRRISLGMKQCQANPWSSFASRYKKGDKISGTIRSVTDFGIFIGLEGGIDGLVHTSDLSWDRPGEELVKEYSKGMQVEAVVASVDPERERIALSIKQLNADPFGDFASKHVKGDVVTGTLLRIENRDAVVVLEEGVEAKLKAAELPDVKEGDAVDAVIAMIDRRNRTIQLSVRQLEQQQDRQAIRNLQNQTVESSGPTTIGDLIRAQMEKK